MLIFGGFVCLDLNLTALCCCHPSVPQRCHFAGQIKEHCIAESFPLSGAVNRKPLDIASWPKAGAHSWPTYFPFHNCQRLAAGLLWMPPVHGWRGQMTRSLRTWDFGPFLGASAAPTSI